MSEKDKSMSTQQQAINDYLQALLHDDNELEVVDVHVTEDKPKTVGLEKLVAEIPEIVEKVETKVESKLETEVALQEEAEQEEVVETAVETVALVEPAVKEQVEVSGIPDWADQSFQCLLFKVSGLTLAVPLVKLNSVIPWTDKIVETPNQTDWYLGLVNNHGKNVKVIDTALMVLPENRRENIPQDPSDRFSHILLVDDSNWGLACDEIGDVIWLTGDDVKWRQNKIKRPWLAGTAIEQMCALMDTEVFADMLNRKTSV